MSTLNSSQNTPKLLVIDDDERISRLFQNIAEELEYTVQCVNDFASISNVLQYFQPDIIFLDLKLQGHDGIEVLYYLAEKKCEAKILVVSGVDQSTLEAAADVGKLHNLNIVGTIKKPFDIEDIERILIDETDTSSKFSSDVMQELLGAGEFQLLFQPFMAIKNLGGAGVADLDATANWRAQSSTSFTASHSILHNLEAQGLIREFGMSFLDKSFESLNQWITRGMDAGIVVQLPDAMYSDSRFPEYVINLTKKYSLPSNVITLGFSERILLESATQIIDVLARLRINSFNVSVQVSNVSTSELDRHLHSPINEIRLGASLVRSAMGSIDKEIDVSSFISQCDKRGIRTRAEGIDSEKVLRLLYESGCTTGSGPYFADPMKYNDLESWLSREDFTEELCAV